MLMKKLYKSRFEGKLYTFPDVLKYARKKGILEITCLTHGQAIDDKLAEEIVDAERVRPHKSFGYNWKTRSVEEIVDENPNITESELRRKAKDIHSDFTDSVISDGIKELKKDSVISESNGKFKHQKDYIHDKESY